MKDHFSTLAELFVYLIFSLVAIGISMILVLCVYKAVSFVWDWAV